MTDDRLSDGNSSHCLWQGEIKRNKILMYEKLT